MARYQRENERNGRGGCLMARDQHRHDVIAQVVACEAGFKQERKHIAPLLAARGDFAAALRDDLIDDGLQPSEGALKLGKAAPGPTLWRYRPDAVFHVVVANLDVGARLIEVNRIGAGAK